MSTPRLRVGIVGCGYQGALLARAVAQSETLSVAACVDPDLGLAVELAQRFSTGRALGSLEELLADDLVDALVIATPHQFLHLATLTGVRAGKHVLVEKPVGINEDQAAAIEMALAGTAIRCMPGYSLRFTEGHRHVQQLIAAGAVGEVQAVTAGIGWQPLTGWRATPETGGGALLYLGSHVVDTVLSVIPGEPQEVYAAATYAAGTGAEETVGFQIRFGRGAMAQCLVTQAVEEWFDYINIYGRDGHISLHASYWLQYTIQVSSRTLSAYRQPTTITPRVTDDPIMMMLVPEVEEFGRAIAESREPLVTIGDGRRVLKVLDAVASSARTRSPVSLRERG